MNTPANALAGPGSVVPGGLHPSRARLSELSMPSGSYYKSNSQYDAKTAKSAQSTSQSPSKSAGTLSVVKDQIDPFVSPQVFLATTCQ
jgi:hypothetical protein